MFKTLGLYRQLRFSHLLVTLVTALMLILCVLIGYFWYASTGQVAAWAAQDALDDAEFISSQQGDKPLEPAASQSYINEMSWPYVEPERRDGLHGEIPDWYASSWYVILTPAGTVIASNQVRGLSSGKRFADLKAPAFDPAWLEVKKPIAYAQKESLKRWVLLGDLHIGFAPIITENNVLLGWIYRRFENESILQFLRGIASTLLYGFLGAAAIAVLTSALIGNRFAKGIAERLSKLNQLSQAYATGDFAQRYQGKPQDEIGQLGEQFNRMAEQISSQVLELRTLANTNAQLLEESRALATLEERNRLARDLHDAVKQQLFGLNLNISAIRQLIHSDPGQASALLEHANRLTSQALEEMDVILRQLRPVSLERKGLVLALQDMLHGWSIQTGVQAKMTVNGQARLSAPLEQCLYRIVQEGLHNVAKHANANQVQLELQFQPDVAQLHLSDDGKGFDVTQHLEHSLGLKSMNERASALGGRFLLESSPRGTVLGVHLPMEAP